MTEAKSGATNRMILVICGRRFTSVASLLVCSHLVTALLIILRFTL